jgi:hypothetical protein
MKYAVNQLCCRYHPYHDNALVAGSLLGYLSRFLFLQDYTHQGLSMNLKEQYIFNILNLPRQVAKAKNGVSALMTQTEAAEEAFAT